ncbi:ectin-like [Tachypleus tridentatus]|uniref:ectin-like n=1 Tax=Tachypleus tridentatus TaxID=6853 RepID=UPI003FD24751
MSCSSRKGQCPVDGSWGIWGLWSKCQGTCGQQGFRVRCWTSNNPSPQHNGYHSSINNREEESCLVFGCDIGTAFPGKFSEWETWGACSNMYGKGQQF